MPIANCNERLNVTVHVDVKKLIEIEASKRFLSKSDFIVQAILYYIKFNK